MRWSRFLVSFFLVLPAALAGVQGASAPRAEAPAVSPVENEVRALDSRRFEAMIRGDVGQLDRILGADLTYTHTSGDLETKKQFLDAISTGQVQYLSIIPSDVHVRVFNAAAAVVTGRIGLKVKFRGTDIAFDARYTAVYVLRDARWQLVASQSTRIPAG
ncbi:MAG TPA: nuclear transport factor 2 family protein [Thermoanaerobaculia bacterium]|nr:nuclear transport factor 2 family protein [Thermoanaerobaculia bacterium]